LPIMAIRVCKVFFLFFLVPSVRRYRNNLVTFFLFSLLDGLFCCSAKLVFEELELVLCVDICSVSSTRDLLASKRIGGVQRFNVGLRCTATMCCLCSTTAIVVRRAVMQPWEEGGSAAVFLCKRSGCEKEKKIQCLFQCRRRGDVQL